MIFVVNFQTILDVKRLKHQTASIGIFTQQYFTSKIILSKTIGAVCSIIQSHLWASIMGMPQNFPPPRNSRPLIFGPSFLDNGGLHNLFIVVNNRLMLVNFPFIVVI